MAASYRVFTVESGKVSEGARIDTLHLKGAGIDIPAIIIGEEGRGREQAAMPVANPPSVPCPARGTDPWTLSDACEKCGTPLDSKKDGGSTRHHPDAGMVTGRLLYAEVGQTKAGKPKFFGKPAPTTEDRIIVIFRTTMGFRGGNSHTGDRGGWKCTKYGCDAAGEGAVEVPETCPKCGATGGWDGGPSIQFTEFPGEILVSGHIAQGDAGRMGSGQQLVALIPRDIVFRTSYSGRRYGAPGSHYYVWNGEKLIAATWDERAAADLF